MTVETITTPTLAARADALSQATAIEQARAVAEVQAAIVVAQQCPRDMQAALVSMRESTAQKALADRAFFKYPRAGQSITGPSIHLARELARVWGNIQYGIKELRRDDDAGMSEMLAYAWDVQTNTRNEQVFLVPHKRDTKGGIKPLVELRDVYENNANQGARRVREAIFAVLPPWFVEEAKERCYTTLTDGGGKPLATRVADALRVYDAMGVTKGQLEAKVGRAADTWTEHDVASLGVTYTSLVRGEIVLSDEFPAPAQARVTAAEIVASGVASAEQDPATEYDPTTEPGFGQ